MANFVKVQQVGGKTIRINVEKIIFYMEAESFISLDEYQECVRVFFGSEDFVDLLESLDDLDKLFGLNEKS